MKTTLLILLAIMVIYQYFKNQSQKRTILHKNALIHVLRYRLGDQRDNTQNGALNHSITNDEKLKLNAFTKSDLNKSWLHGCIRSPKYLAHLNNFDAYFRAVYLSGMPEYRNAPPPPPRKKPSEMKPLTKDEMSKVRATGNPEYCLLANFCNDIKCLTSKCNFDSRI